MGSFSRHMEDLTFFEEIYSLPPRHVAVFDLAGLFQAAILGFRPYFSTSLQVKQ